MKSVLYVWLDLNQSDLEAPGEALKKNQTNKNTFKGFDRKSRDTFAHLRSTTKKPFYLKIDQQ